MVTAEISPGEYANFMVEEAENLIVKVGRQLPPEMKIPGEVIKDWRLYALYYFQKSPNAFLSDDELYQDIYEGMKVKIVKENLLLDFQKQFNILFQDAEFGYKADDQLVTMISSSLQYEHPQSGESILTYNNISTGIYFIENGFVKMFYKDSKHPLVILEKGSYFGDISFIFQIINKYRLVPNQGQ